MPEPTAMAAGRSRPAREVFFGPCGGSSAGVPVLASVVATDLYGLGC
ncbi:hypothetical protein I547_0168 [Mycobacterium kansasii 824]|nr:hypothetical protein I547_0168 [Mycobacterium kansasii 824]